MMSKTLWRTACAASLVAGALAACGGGGDDGGPTLATQASSAYGVLLAQLNSASGLASAAAGSMFGSNYLDAGFTRAQLLDALGKESTAVAASPDYSLFPMATVSNVTITDCVSAVCTMSGTLTNSDADETAVPFTTKVLVIGNQIQLLGDQQAS
jgi:hypothetical protein